MANIHKADRKGPVFSAYEIQVAQGSIENDPVQLQVVEALDRLVLRINDDKLRSKSSALGWLFSKRQEERLHANGLYIWGGVGRGKSFLMDMFFEEVEGLTKRRVHFHAFMDEVHGLINKQRAAFKEGKSKEKDPVPPVARKIASEARVLCFDEFVVTDITDAMLLSRLFAVLFTKNVMVVATSNVPPDELYKDGLNRKLFLPFVDLLTSKVIVHELRSPTDYRMAKIGVDRLFNYPLNAATRRIMDDSWNVLCDGANCAPGEVENKGRKIRVPQATSNAARFSFDDLCRAPLSASDYLRIADSYSTIMLDDVPIIAASERNEARRLISLIDVLYDNHNHLVVSADVAADKIYAGTSGREAMEFERTASRLIEMQSLAYHGKADAA